MGFWFVGHENHGVHVCHKCGWAFPNPHPSAKQRRAHKKVCGKIAGLKIAGSEEKFHSDSDSDEANKHSCKNFLIVHLD